MLLICWESYEDEDAIGTNKNYYLYINGLIFSISSYAFWSSASVHVIYVNSDGHMNGTGNLSYKGGVRISL